MSLGPFGSILFPVIKAPMPAFSVNDLVSVQAMSAEPQTLRELWIIWLRNKKGLDEYGDKLNDTNYQYNKDKKSVDRIWNMYERECK